MDYGTSTNITKGAVCKKYSDSDGLCYTGYVLPYKSDCTQKDAPYRICQVDPKQVDPKVVTGELFPLNIAASAINTAISGTPRKRHYNRPAWFAAYCNLPAEACADPSKTKCTRWTGDPKDLRNFYCQGLLSGWRSEYGWPVWDKTAIRRIACASIPEGYDSSHCGCVNRSQDPVWQALKPASPMADSCWYKPCQKGSPADAIDFIPTDAIPGKGQKCPSKVCSTITAVVRANNVTVQDCKEKVDCDFDVQPTPPPPIPPAFGTIQWLKDHATTIIAFLLVLTSVLLKTV